MLCVNFDSLITAGDVRSPYLSYFRTIVEQQAQEKAKWADSARKKKNRDLHACNLNVANNAPTEGQVITFVF